MTATDRPLVWLHGEVKTPPFSLVILEVFSKKTPRTPEAVIDTCRQRLRSYDDA
jgi:hypothetical protein